MLDRATQSLPQNAYPIIHLDRDCHYTDGLAGPSGSTIRASPDLCRGKDIRQIIQPVKVFWGGWRMKCSVAVRSEVSHCKSLYSKK